MAEPVGDSRAVAEGRPASRLPWAILAAVAVLVAGALVAGCGGGDDETTPQTATETTTATEEEGGDEAGEGAEEGEAEMEGAGGISPAEGNASAGGQLFADNCAVCHGTKGSGGATGPSLQEPELAEDSDEVVTQIVQGGGGMPAFGEQLSDQEIADVAAFVVEDLAKR